MTRINSAFRVEFLTDEHLRAEHREIKRLPQVYTKRRFSKQGLSGLPEEFTLGTGHVLFFIDKGYFTLQRYLALYKECKRRGFNVTDYSTNWLVYKDNLKDYSPTGAEQKILLYRIRERLINSCKPHWYFHGGKISAQDALLILKKSTLYETENQNPPLGLDINREYFNLVDSNYLGLGTCVSSLKTVRL